MVFQLDYVAKKTSTANTPVSVIEKVEEPLKAFVKVKTEKNSRRFVNSFPLTVNTIKL
jgi:hypothetical protein